MAIKSISRCERVFLPLSGGGIWIGAPALQRSASQNPPGAPPDLLIGTGKRHIQQPHADGSFCRLNPSVVLPGGLGCQVYSAMMEKTGNCFTPVPGVCCAPTYLFDYRVTRIVDRLENLASSLMPRKTERSTQVTSQLDIRIAYGWGHLKPG